MHDIWNPWHGCIKCSEGCENCYMYYLDHIHGNKDGSVIYKTSGFNYPLSKNRDGTYKVKSGEKIRVCMCSDFFLKEADIWRDEAWEIIRQRPDVVFFLLTKRPERIADCLPYNWGDGWENIFLNVTAENQRRADERIPILLSTPARHKGIMTAPLIGSIDIEEYLKSGQLEQVICGGENYDGARICEYAWVQSLSAQCKRQNVSFCFTETGTKFAKDGKLYNIRDKHTQAEMALKSGMSFEGKPIVFNFCDNLGLPLPSEQLYHPHFSQRCAVCASRTICNGCADCKKCTGDPDFSM